MAWAPHLSLWVIILMLMMDGICIPLVESRWLSWVVGSDFIFSCGGRVVDGRFWGGNHVLA